MTFKVAKKSAFFLLQRVSVLFFFFFSKAGIHLVHPAKLPRPISGLVWWLETFNPSLRKWQLPWAQSYPILRVCVPAPLGASRDCDDYRLLLHWGSEMLWNDAPSTARFLRRQCRFSTDPGVRALLPEEPRESCVAKRVSVSHIY